MAEYKAPIEDIEFTLKYLVKVDRLSEHALFSEANEELIGLILSESSKLAEREIAPTNQIGDQIGCSIDGDGDGEVITPKGFNEAYQAFTEAGWSSLQFDPEYGGQGLPFILSTAVLEMVQSANMAWSLSSLLTQGAIDAIYHNADNTLKQAYLPKMISGQWTGTMNLTEPQAGSDLVLIKSSATRENDHYLIKGQKIFITWGEHDMAENIVHLVLARLPDCPAGVKGISLFVVPKFLIDEEGNIGARNDCKAISIEHKLGIHGSPTCVMSFGENEGAIGYLVGEEHRGLACMFTMMNTARLMVGLQGVSIAERALQDATLYASERRQGNLPGTKETCTIDQHPDVQRMLMTMRALTQAGRAVAYVACSGVDLEKIAVSSEQEKAKSRLALLTPIVKGWVTEIAQEVTSLAIQVHGGMGFIEETGVAQHFRDARILPIYEGTTGIQALDLVGRKTLYDQGQAYADLIAEMRDDTARIESQLPDYAGHCQALNNSIVHIENTITALVAEPKLAAHAAHDFLYLSGYACGAWQMLLTLESCATLASDASPNQTHLAQLKQSASFYLQHLHPRTLGHAASINAIEL